MNILILDKSQAFSLGLKNSILKINIIKNIDSIEISQQLNYEYLFSNNIELLFIDYDFLKSNANIELIKNFKKQNSNFKIIVSTNVLTNIDLNLLLTIQPNGFFSKSISKIEFKLYLKKVMQQVYFMDFVAMNKQVHLELERKHNFSKKFKLLSSLEVIDKLENQMSVRFISNPVTNPVFSLKSI